MRSTDFVNVRSRFWWLCGLVLCIGLLSAQPAFARNGNAVWGGLVFATNEPGQTSGRYDNHPYAQRFRPIFGYRYYDLLQSDRQIIRPRGVNQLQLGREYTAKLRYLGPRQKGQAFAMELYHRNRKVVESTVVLGRDSPFVIRGPQYGKGQILFLLMVR